MDTELLPVHGFVLAGGQSSRMGHDKALLPFRGRPMAEIAVEKLRSFCSAVSICGNRDDLSQYAPVVHEARQGIGPAAGVEAGLEASSQPWAMFMPVDVPLIPAEHLQRWVREAIRVGMSVSLLAGTSKQPAFCMLNRERARSFSRTIDQGERSLERLLRLTADRDSVASWMYAPHDLYRNPEDRGPDEALLELWFSNLNTPEELQSVEGSDTGFRWA